MTHEHAQSMIDELDDLLEAERGALIAGDLEEIGALIERKETLIDALNGLELPAGQSLVGMRDKLDRNQVLLESALNGIRRVANRMATLRRIRDTLETYDAEGRRRTIQGEVVRKVEKRA